MIGKKDGFLHRSERFVEMELKKCYYASRLMGWEVFIVGKV